LVKVFEEAHMLTDSKTLPPPAKGHCTEARCLKIEYLD